MPFTYLGKNKRGDDAKIAGGLKVSVDDIIGLKPPEEKIRYLTNDKTGDVLKIDLSNSPLLLRDFGVKKINNLTLIRGGQLKKNINVSKNPIELNRRITGTIYALIVVTYDSSGATWPKDIFINVNNQILESQEKVEQMVLNEFYTLYPQFKPPSETDDLGTAIFGLLSSNTDTSIEIVKLEFITKNKVSLKFENMKLRGVGLDITKIYGENVDLNKTNDNNCVKNALIEYLGKYIMIIIHI